MSKILKLFSIKIKKRACWSYSTGSFLSLMATNFFCRQTSGAALRKD
jgi:hypothetical protein